MCYRATNTQSSYGPYQANGAGGRKKRVANSEGGRMLAEERNPRPPCNSSRRPLSRASRSMSLSGNGWMKPPAPGNLCPLHQKKPRKFTKKCRRFFKTHLTLHRTLRPVASNQRVGDPPGRTELDHHRRPIFDVWMGTHRARPVHQARQGFPL